MIFPVAHFLVDAVCVATIFGGIQGRIPGEAFCLAILLYNTCAFLTQVALGWALDRRGASDSGALVVSLLMVLGGSLISRTNVWIGVTLFGLGNSLFHVAAGREVIISARGKAAPLGVFVGPGALGLGLGTVAGTWLLWPAFAALGGVCGVAVWRLMNARTAIESGVAHRKAGGADLPGWTLAACGAILFCVFCRSIAGNRAPAPVPNEFLWVCCAGCAGKMAGGFLVDHWGFWKVGIGALFSSLLLLSLAHGVWQLSLLGQGVSNVMMPVTLGLLALFCPRQPGLMFGAAASVLYLGFLFRYFPGPAATMLACQALGILAFVGTRMICRREQAAGNVSEVAAWTP